MATFQKCPSHRVSNGLCYFLYTLLPAGLYPRRGGVGGFGGFGLGLEGGEPLTLLAGGGGGGGGFCDIFSILGIPLCQG